MAAGVWAYPDLVLRATLVLLPPGNGGTGLGEAAAPSLPVGHCRGRDQSPPMEAGCDLGQVELWAHCRARHSDSSRECHVAGKVATQMGLDLCDLGLAVARFPPPLARGK